MTTGPLLSFAINGKGIGRGARVASGEPIRIEASVLLDPGVDDLDRLEVIGPGTVLATQEAGSGGWVEVEHRVTASRSTGSW